jgi:hypothetical protein
MRDAAGAEGMAPVGRIRVAMTLACQDVDGPTRRRTRPGSAACSASSTATASPRSRSSGPTGRSSTRCSAPATPWWWSPPAGPPPARPLRPGRQQARPLRRLRARRHPAHRWPPPGPAAPRHPQTLALRAAVRARTDLVEARVALCNQHRAHLRVVFPASVGLFADLDAPTSLAFLARFPSQDAAA